MSWICLSAQAAIASGDLLFPEKEVSTESCHYHFVPKHSSMNLRVNTTDVIHTE